jgi:hypothetical protein
MLIISFEVEMFPHMSLTISDVINEKGYGTVLAYQSIHRRFLFGFTLHTRCRNMGNPLLMRNGVIFVNNEHTYQRYLSTTCLPTWSLLDRNTRIRLDFHRTKISRYSPSFSSPVVTVHVMNFMWIGRNKLGHK